MTSLMVGCMGDRSVDEVQEVDPNGATRTPMNVAHALTSKEPKQSAVERITKAVEDRQEQRVVVTYNIHVALIQECRRIAIRKGYTRISRITISDLLEYQDRVAKKLASDKKRPWYGLFRLLGFRNRNEQLSRVLNRAVALVEDQAKNQQDEHFYYMDFNAYYTRVESRFPWMRNGIRVAIGYVFLFYLFTPIVFCKILHDEGVCPQDADHPNAGWMNSLYFASATLSTVGYGDVTVDKTKKRHIGFAIVYMIVANATLIGSFSVAASNMWNPLSNWRQKVMKWMLGEAESDEPMHKKLRRVYIFRASELIGGFILLNLIGMMANRAFLYQQEIPGLEWHWLASLYWAIQTTTTIGYGDLEQPDSQRFFQVFYLILSTYFAGAAISGLSGLRAELEQIRRETAWERREVNKTLRTEAQEMEHDGKVDQYEFLVASLVHLGKIGSKDVIPIMDKFRSLASDDGFIDLGSGVPTDEATNEEVDEELQRAKRKDIFHSIRSSFFRKSRSRPTQGTGVNDRSTGAGLNGSAGGAQLSEDVAGGRISTP